LNGLASFVGFLLLLLLTSLAAFASAGWIARAELRGRAEELLAVGLVWNALILVPIHCLGLTHQLTRTNLALASLAFSSLVWAASFARVASRRQHFTASLRVLGALLSVPRDAVTESARARSLVFVAVLATLAILGWTLWLSYLVPSDSWDGMWYHEAMVGYAIQDRGYSVIPLPQDLFQQANGYPRNCEMTNLWFVIFTGQRLIEVPNTILSVPLLMATYCMVRRYSHERLAAMGWACAFFLVPGAVLQMRSTYIDLHVAALFMGALHFCTRPRLRLRDGVLAAIALTLLVGAKSVALAWVPILAVAAVAFVLPNARTRPWSTLAVVVGGAVLITAGAAITYVRNWVLFDNPLWPVGFESATLGIRWRGVFSFESAEWNQPLSTVYARIAAVPKPGRDFADTPLTGYGMAVPFVLLPGAALALIMLMARRLRAFIEWLRSAPSALRAPAENNLFAVTLILLMTATASRALWSTRYNLHLIAGLVFLIAWWCTSYRARRIEDGIISFTVIAHLIALYWVEPAVGSVSVSRALEYAAMSAAERDTHYPRSWTMAPHVAAARDRELGPGTRVYFNKFDFVGSLWNSDYSNFVHYIDAREFLQRAARDKPDWVVVAKAGALYRAFMKQADEWEPIGPAQRDVVAFRRRAGR
jgi:hypothetical protein